MTINICNEKAKSVLKKKKILENNLLKHFLEDEYHVELFENSIKYPTQDNLEKVEIAFKDYYVQIRKFAYINSIIRQYSIDFDKKRRKIKKRYMLTLDKPIDPDSNSYTPYKDLNYESNANKFEDYKTLKDSISHPNLFNALSLLTKFQYDVLELIYVHNLTKTEVSKIFNTSNQNITNTHRRALNKIRKFMECDKSECR